MNADPALRFRVREENPFSADAAYCRARRAAALLLQPNIVCALRHAGFSPHNSLASRNCRFRVDGSYFSFCASQRLMIRMA